MCKALCRGGEGGVDRERPIAKRSHSPAHQLNASSHGGLRSWHHVHL